MIYVHWIFLIAYTLTAVGAMVAVLMDNRQPAKTMAWLLVLTFLPIVGLILYFFFGKNIRKQRLVSQRSLDQLSKRSMLEFAEQNNLHLPSTHKSLMKLFANQSLALPFKDNEVSIYCDGYEFFPALLAEIGRATHHIHLDTYIIADDPLGRLLADSLMDKARNGVEVRLIYDDVGCWNVPNSFFERMRNAGIDVHAFLPVRFPSATSKMNYRNHRKLCVIDGKVGFIGGMNIAIRYVKGTGMQPWRDTHIRIRGGAVYGIQRAFLTDWYFVDRTLITSRMYYPEVDPRINNNCIAQIVTSSPISPWPDIMQGYVRILLEARRYVYLESPYYLPTETILFALRTAALAEVDVRLIIPMNTDAKFVDWASRSYLQETLDAGIKIYMYKPGFIHSKLLVCDDFLCSCGSTNVDFRSFENNFEANAFFYDEGMALRMKSIFMRDLKECIPMNELPERMHRSYHVRFWESLVRLLAPLM